MSTRRRIRKSSNLFPIRMASHFISTKCATGLSIRDKGFRSS